MINTIFILVLRYIGLYYSVSISMVIEDSICISLSEYCRYRTIMKKERVGLCSNYLATLPLNSSVRLFAEPGSFKFPTDRPVIMVWHVLFSSDFSSQFLINSQSIIVWKLSQLSVYCACFWDSWINFLTRQILHENNTSVCEINIINQYQITHHQTLAHI